ncbi:zinc-binding dehydrogenase [Chachezhania sediminis]|uniref:zinc-binding dehydrogenase n=1 Tax=Chachezhania sediminis TaxID=2599291 RepID=UPI00131D93A6|nr:zinc-binding dehydrogenase [Chachezhania sediminis]
MGKAAVFHGTGQPLSIEQVPEPVVDGGHVVIRVQACGVCGSDLHATQEGVFLQEAGTILGHEFAGEVIASDDPDVPVGLRAAAVPVNACDSCRQMGFGSCRKNLGILCPENRITGLALSVPGAYAQTIRVGAKQVVPLPEGVSYDEGALVEPLAVGLHAVDRADIPLGGRVLVIGAGPIGLAVTAFARLRGAGAVVVSEYAPARREAAAAFGADTVLDPGQTPDVGAAFAEAAGGPPDVIFDCVGVPGIIQQAIDLAPVRGTIVLVGVCMKPDQIIPISATLKELKLQFVLGYAEADFARVLDMMGRGLIDAKSMITDTTNLEGLPDAFEALRKPGSQIKLMIHPNG